MTKWSDKKMKLKQEHINQPFLLLKEDDRIGAKRYAKGHLVIPFNFEQWLDTYRLDIQEHATIENGVVTPTEYEVMGFVYEIKTDQIAIGIPEIRYGLCQIVEKETGKSTSTSLMEEVGRWYGKVFSKL